MAKICDEVAGCHDEMGTERFEVEGKELVEAVKQE